MNNITSYIGPVIIIINILFIWFLVAKHRKKSFILWHSLAVALLMITLTIAFFIIQLHSGENDTNLFPFLRNVLLIVSGTVAVISLLMTSYNASVTSRNSLDTHKANVIFNLIKNNHSLIESKDFKASLSMVNKELQSLHETKYKFIIASISLRNYLVSNKAEFEKTLIQVEESGVSTVTPHSIKAMNRLLEALNNNKTLKDNGFDPIEEIQRLLVTYYSEADASILDTRFPEQSNKDSYKDFFRVIRDTNFGIDLERYIKRNNSLIIESYKHEDLSIKITEIFNKHYEDIGPFFRNTHRIVKLINESFHDPIERKNYLGILRSYYSPKIMTLLYVNCVFTKRGTGLAEQLLHTDFFGDENDIKGSNGPHLSKESLFHSQQNEKILLLFTCQNTIKKKLFSAKQQKNNVDDLYDVFAKTFDS